jgi:hypothetical protein
MIYAAVVNTAAAFATAHCKPHSRRFSDATGYAILTLFQLLTISQMLLILALVGLLLPQRIFFSANNNAVLSSKFLTLTADYYFATLWLVLVIQQLIAIRPPASLYFS